MVTDVELDDLYFNPNDLRDTISWLSDIACPRCQSKTWKFDYIEELPIDNPWAWAV